MKLPFSYYHLYTLILTTALGFGISACGETQPDTATETDTASDSPDASDAVDTETDTAYDTDSETDTATESEPWEVDAGDLSFADVPREEIGETPFAQDVVLEYRVTMDPSVYEDMKAHGDDEIYRPAILTVSGPGIEPQHYPKVGIRYKGDYSLHHCWDEHGGVRSYSGECAKLSCRIKLTEYNEDARLFGLKKINLHAMSEDSTKLRERLAYKAFNDFGVPTSRTAHAVLTINDEGPQLVLAVEQIDGRYTAYRYLESGDGNVYKEVWPHAGLTESDITPQLRTNDDPEDTPDISDFIAFGEAVSAATEETFRNEMNAYTDVTQALRYMALDRAFKNWDGITAFYWPDRPHNNYWYKDDTEGSLFELIPWDLDKTLWEYDPYMDPYQWADEEVPNWNVLPASCDRISVWDSNGAVTVMPPGCDNFINLLAATGWDEFAVIGQEALDTVLQYDAMDASITEWADQIAPFVEDDPLLYAASWQMGVESFRAVVQKLLADFEAHLEEGYIVEE